MKLEPLPLSARIDDYVGQARMLLAAHGAGEEWAIELLHQHHPRFLDPVVPWLPQRIDASVIRDAALDPDDARLTVARGYSFRNWAALEALVAEMANRDSPAREFEIAAEAVITGNRPDLEAMLRANPDLVRARSTRLTCHDPPAHRATLLHYLGANGIEGYRQRSPGNAVEIARVLLEAGAEVDALAGMYGGEYPTLSMLVSSSPPADAGVQGPLAETLLDFGAAIEGCGSPQWKSPLLTALVFGFLDTAETLVRRGARVGDLVTAAGLGRLGEATRLLDAAGPAARHRALALAAQLGHTDVVRLLLEAGEDPDRYNPDGFHAHATPLHQAALAGREPVVRLLVERGARLDLKDALWQATPLGWAQHAGQAEVERYLSARGAP